MSKKKRDKPPLPIAGDRVELRGRNKHGTLLEVDDTFQWCHVKWDDGRGPRYCHIMEMLKVENV